MAGLALGLALVAGACGRTSPSTVPLGGEEDGSSAAQDSPTRDLSQGPTGEPEPEDTDEEPEEPEEDVEDEEPEEEIIIEDDDGDDDGDLEGDATDPAAQLDATDDPPSAPPVTPICDDSKPTIFDCRPLNRACPALAPMCTVFESLLKPKVGMAVAACIAEQRCRLDDDDCLRESIRLACVDDATRTFCEDRYDSCQDEFDEAEVTRQDCEYAVSSLLPNVRSRFTACLATSCDVERCLLRLLP